MAPDGAKNEDLREGFGRVQLPHALAVKYPSAPAEWGWQFVFPGPTRSRDPRTGERRRHHVHERSVQKAFQVAVRKAGIVKPATCHTLRHYAESRIMPSSRSERPPNCLKAGEDPGLYRALGSA